MRYFKIDKNGIILAVGTGSSGTEISKTEYEQILETINSRPHASEGYGYRLKNDLTWELYELPPDEDEPAEEADYLAALDKLGVSADD